ncbi:MAG: ATP-binding protein [Patescibacteria group bacterium]
MPKPLLIIISGKPGTGKTTLGKKIAKEFHLPFISKDAIKESLFDDLGWSDRAWSRKLGVATYSLLYYFIESLLSAGVSFIAESNFKPELANETFQALKKKHGFKLLQIMCETKGEVLFERFKARTESGERHPGHVDHLNLDEFKEMLLKGGHEPLDIGGQVYRLDTTDFNSIDYKKLFSAIKSALIRK